LDALRWDGEGEGDAGDFHLEGSHPRGANRHGVFDFGRRAAYFEIAYLAGHTDDFSLGSVEVEAGLVEASLQEAVPGGFADAVFRCFTGLTLIGRVNVVVDRRHLLVFGVPAWALVWDAPLVLFSAFQSPNAYFLRRARRVIGS
jgi:hypothetical protein